MGFRHYNPGLNRFLSRDMYTGGLADLNLTMSPLTNNRYAFAGGNPISLVEFDGHVPLGPTDGTGDFFADHHEATHWLDVTTGDRSEPRQEPPRDDGADVPVENWEFPTTPTQVLIWHAERGLDVDQTGLYTPFEVWLWVQQGDASRAFGKLYDRELSGWGSIIACSSLGAQLVGAGSGGICVAIGEGGLAVGLDGRAGAGPGSSLMAIGSISYSTAPVSGGTTQYHYAQATAGEIVVVGIEGTRDPASDHESVGFVFGGGIGSPVSAHGGAGRTRMWQLLSW
jgi:RHS repeat-associated protein